MSSSQRHDIFLSTHSFYEIIHHCFISIMIVSKMETKMGGIPMAKIECIYVSKIFSPKY